MSAARNNDLARAWSLIQEARKLRPEDLGVMQDYLAIGAWSGHGAEVLPHARSLDLGKLKRFVLEALGRSAREAKDFAFSKACYEEVLKREPDRREARLGLIWVALNTRHYEDASRGLESVPLEARGEKAFCEVRAALAEARQDWVELLTVSEALLAKDPGQKEALRWRFQALRRMGLPERALEVTPLDSLTGDEKVALQRDVLGVQQARLSASRHPQERDRLYQDLKGRYQSLLSQLPAQLQPDIRLGLIQDYLGLLSAHADYSAVLSEAQALIRLPLKASTAIHRMLGEAWLHQGRPSKALQEFDSVLLADPGNTDAQLGRFWALLDQGRWREARAASLASLNRTKAPEPGAPWSRAYLNAVRLEAQALGYTDALGEAEAKLEALRKKAPADDSTLEALALVWRFQGRPRQAVALLESSAQRSPDRGWTWLSLAAAQRESGDYAGESKSLERAGQGMQGTQGLADARRESQLARGAGFSMEGQSGHSRDVAPNAPTGSEEQNYVIRAESPLLLDAWRLRAEARRDETRIHDQPLQRDRIGMALGYGNSIWRGEVGFGTQNHGVAVDQEKATAMVRGIWTPTDAWWLEAQYAKNSEEAPLRGWDAGVHGDLASLAVSYRWQEMGSLRCGYSRLLLSDGNLRQSSWLSGERRLFAWGPHVVTGATGLWISSNSLPSSQASYFNPGRDRSVNVEISYVGPLWQEGAARVRQQCQISGGRYLQSGQDGRGTFVAAYNLLVGLGRRLEGHVGIRFAERPYDGVINRGTELRFGLSGRLP